MSSPSTDRESTSPGPWPLDRWRRLTRLQRLEFGVLALLVVGTFVHQVVLANWYIEDAAISFAYARNLAHGEGLVPFPGGERVEGYSNPSWVLLLAVFELVGISAEYAARGLQLLLAMATVPLVYRLGREAAPRHRVVGLLAATVLTFSSQFAIWGASGLENALFNFLLAMGLWRLTREARTGGFPWSAVWFFLVAITRPEAVLYAAAAGAVVLFAHLKARRGLGPVLRWAALFGVLFGAYQAWRWSYFAWPLPNTYYAKLGEHRTPQLLQWEGKGWRYVRNWASTMGTGVLLPLVFLGLTGSRGAPALATVGASLVVAFTVLLPGDQRLLLPAVLLATWTLFRAAAGREERPSPRASALGLLFVALLVGAAELARAGGAESGAPAPLWLFGSAPYAIAAVFLLLPLATLSRPGAVARLACWATAGVAVFFAIASSGDWMKGFRWMSLLAVPGSVLLASGLAALADYAQDVLGKRPGAWRWAGWGALALGLLGWAVPNVRHTQQFVRSPETSPYSVKMRVDYMNGVRDRLHIDERVVALDVDQGAHLWWSTYRMLDVAGLVDVPMAQSRFERSFIREYLFEENRPHFAHVHGGWASYSRIPTHPEFREGYVEIPGYPSSRSRLHIGNHIRRDLVMTDTWPESVPERTRLLEGEFELVGWRIPSPEAAPGRRFYLEAGFRTLAKRTSDDVRIVAFVRRGDHLVSWELAPGYDWIPPSEWKTTEIFHGRWSLELPEDLPTGRYELGFVLLGPDGVLEAIPLESDPPRFARGEVRFPDALQVAALDEVLAAAHADRDRAVDLATTAACEEAEQSWWLARMHLPREEAWVAEHAPALRRTIAECWVMRAEAEPSQQVAHLERAREWDHRSRRVRAAARPVADALHARGLAAREAEDWEEAYRAFADVMRVDPSRSWSRRHAETARQRRLGYHPEIRARKEAELRDALERRTLEPAPVVESGAPPDGGDR